MDVGDQLAHEGPTWAIRKKREPTQMEVEDAIIDSFVAHVDSQITEFSWYQTLALSYKLSN